VTAASIPDTVDLIVNSDLLTRSPRYRRQCETELAALTGQEVLLNDASEHDNDFQPGSAGPASRDLRRTDVLDANHAAETFLAEQSGADWADDPIPRQIGLLLAEASFCTLDQTRRSWPATRPTAPHDERIALEASVRAITQRAERAEEELATIYASRSWALTAPLRASLDGLRRAASLLTQVRLKTAQRRL
jgi:hypothetical protein